MTLLAGLDEATQALMLATGPIGRWCTAAGTADILGVSEVSVAADGSGAVLSGGETISFAWRMTEPGVLEVSALDHPEDEQDWERVELEFRTLQTDVGAFLVLGQVKRSGFWFLVDPLRHVEVPDPATRKAKATDPSLVSRRHAPTPSSRLRRLLQAVGLATLALAVAAAAPDGPVLRSVAATVAAGAHDLSTLADLSEGSTRRCQVDG